MGIFIVALHVVVVDIPQKNKNKKMLTQDLSYDKVSQVGKEK